MIIGISGKLQSGKDTVAKQILTLDDIAYPAVSSVTKHNWKVVRFADKLKDIICLLTGCTRGELEDEEFKNRKLPLEWIRYGYADGFIKKYIGDGAMGEPIMINKQCDKERYEIELKTNWQTAYKAHLTYREMLQCVGTDLFRKQFHEDTWVNATMVDYKGSYKVIGAAISLGQDRYTIPNGHGEHSGKVIKNDTFQYESEIIKYPNWIIPDVRFPNEIKAIKSRGGIVIRIEREDERSRFARNDTANNKSKYYHPSEIALDDYTDWDFSINNNGTLEELYEEVKAIYKIILTSYV